MSPENCTICEVGFKARRKFSEGREAGSYCEKITDAEGDQSEYVNHCASYDHMFIGTDTFLAIGCVECEDNFINVGGLCVANITQQYYKC